VNDRVNKTFKAADIKKVVTASGRTKDAAKKRADDFAYVAGKGNFDEQAKEINLQVMEVPAITKDSFIPGAGQNKSVSKFAFSESKNSVSDPIKIQGGYAVYQITEKIPAGYMNFDEIKNTVLLPRVKAEKKLDLLKQSMMDLRSKITGNDLKSLKTLNPQLNIQQADSFTVAKPYPAIGNDYAFDYELYKLKDGQISEPIRTQRGYYLVQMLHVTPFDSTKFKAQFDSIRNSLLEQKKQDILQEWISDLRDKAKIVDNRDKYFR
jgi:peptidyl-prolyl cis-trans isomerase D